MLKGFDIWHQWLIWIDNLKVSWSKIICILKIFNNIFYCLCYFMIFVPFILDLRLHKYQHILKTCSLMPTKSTTSLIIENFAFPFLLIILSTIHECSFLLFFISSTSLTFLLIPRVDSEALSKKVQTYFTFFSNKNGKRRMLECMRWWCSRGEKMNFGLVFVKFLYWLSWWLGIWKKKVEELN